jgi:hypothetical protein
MATGPTEEGFPQALFVVRRQRAQVESALLPSAVGQEPLLVSKGHLCLLSSATQPFRVACTIESIAAGPQRLAGRAKWVGRLSSRVPRFFFDLLFDMQGGRVNCRRATAGRIRVMGWLGIRPGGIGMDVSPAEYLSTTKLQKRLFVPLCGKVSPAVDRAKSFADEKTYWKS